MVQAAISSLKERGGPSLQAIKKYIASTYKVDAEKLAPFIKKYIKVSVTSGGLVQTKGKGASSSFKLPAADKGTFKAKKPVAKKPARKKAATSTAKPKAKTTKKLPTTPKVPKPKKAKAPAAKAAKKPAASKAKKATPRKK